MELSEAELNWFLGCLLLVGLLVAYPALTTAIGFLRAHHSLGKLFGPSSLLSIVTVEPDASAAASLR
jgi:hypothetical protein